MKQSCLGVFCLLAFSFAAISQSSEGVPAFPGAEGGGAEARGGRHGSVYEVTNLNDSGKGSLRYGLRRDKNNKKIPLNIIFKVSGAIHLKSALKIENDGYITIAGQTAPVGGITISGRDMRSPLLLIQNSHDIVIRYIRFRHGGEFTPRLGQTRDGKFRRIPRMNGLTILAGSHRIMLDHLSISWGGLQNISFWGKEEPVWDITLQNSVVAEGMHRYSHSIGLLVGGQSSEGMTGISVHHNFFAHNSNRNPLIKSASAEVINNIIYDWYWWGAGVSGGAVVDFIGNRFVAGPSCCRKGARAPILVKPYSILLAAPGVKGAPSIHLEGNRVGHNTRDSLWGEMLEPTELLHWGAQRGLESKPQLPSEYASRGRQIQSAYPVTVDQIDNQFVFERSLLADVGASTVLSGVGGWVSSRDKTDERIISQYMSETRGVERVLSDGRIYRVLRPDRTFGSKGVLSFSAPKQYAFPKIASVGNKVDWRRIAKEYCGGCSDEMESIVATDLRQGFLYWRRINKGSEEEYQFPKVIRYAIWDDYKKRMDSKKDADKDGMPSQWEARYALDDTVSDGHVDFDGDGYTNLEEYFNGTNPLVSERAFFRAPDSAK